MQFVKIVLVSSFFQILDEIEEHNIKIYHLPDAESDEDEDFKEQTRLLKVRTVFRCRRSPRPIFCHLPSKQKELAQGQTLEGSTQKVSR